MRRSIKSCKEYQKKVQFFFTTNCQHYDSEITRSKVVTFYRSFKYFLFKTNAGSIYTLLILITLCWVNPLKDKFAVPSNHYTFINIFVMLG